MLEAKLYIYVETMPPLMDRIRYVTDMTSEKTVCKLKDFFESLKREHSFKREIVDDIKTKLNCGMCLIIDLETKEVFRYDELDKIKIRSGTIRRAAARYKTSFDLANERIERLVKGTLFND